MTPAKLALFFVVQLFLGGAFPVEPAFGESPTESSDASAVGSQQKGENEKFSLGHLSNRLVGIGRYQDDGSSAEQWLSRFNQWRSLQSEGNTPNGLGIGLVVGVDPKTRRVKILTASDLVPANRKDGQAASEVWLSGWASGASSVAKLISYDRYAGLAVLETDIREEEVLKSLSADLGQPQGALRFPTFEHSQVINSGDQLFLVSDPRGLLLEGAPALASVQVRRRGWRRPQLFEAGTRLGNLSWAWPVVRLNHLPETGIAGSLAFRADGQLVGVASAPDQSAYEGLGVEINLYDDDAKPVVKALAEGKNYPYGFVGFEVQVTGLEHPSPHDGVWRFKKESSALLIGNLQKGSPFDNGTFQTGDVIFDVEKRQCSGSEEILHKIALVSAGEEVILNTLNVDVRHINALPPQNQTIRLARLPCTANFQYATEPQFPKWRGLSFSFSFPTIEDDESQFAPKIDTLRYVEGVSVVSVDEGSQAGIAGLTSGMVIVRVGERDVHSPNEFMEACHEWTGGVPLMVAGETREFWVDAPAR